MEREKSPISLLECARHLSQPHPFQELQDTQPGDRVGLCGSHVAKKKFFFLLGGYVPACRGRGGENRGPTSLSLDPHPRPGALVHRTLCASVCGWVGLFPTVSSLLLPTTRAALSPDPEGGMSQVSMWASCPTPPPLAWISMRRALMSCDFRQRGADGKQHLDIVASGGQAARVSVISILARLDRRLTHMCSVCSGGMNGTAHVLLNGETWRSES